MTARQQSWFEHIKANALTVGTMILSMMWWAAHSDAHNTIVDNNQIEIFSKLKTIGTKVDTLSDQFKDFKFELKEMKYRNNLK